MPMNIGYTGHELREIHEIIEERQKSLLERWPDIDEDLSTEGMLRGAPAPKSKAPLAA